LASLGEGGHKDVHGECGGNIMYSCMKMEKWDLLKLFRNGEIGDKR
jgi:hypothetical protein